MFRKQVPVLHCPKTSPITCSFKQKAAQETATRKLLKFSRNFVSKPAQLGGKTAQLATLGITLLFLGRTQRELLVVLSKLTFCIRLICQCYAISAITGLLRLPKFFLTLFCQCYVITATITHALACCVFLEKLGIKNTMLCFSISFR